MEKHKRQRSMAPTELPPSASISSASGSCLKYTSAAPAAGELTDLFGLLRLFCGSEEIESGFRGGEGKLQEEQEKALIHVVNRDFATERQRRQQLNDTYKTMRSLVPNHKGFDRASVIGDTIDYIKELLQKVHELKLIVKKKRRERKRIKLQREEEDYITGNMERYFKGLRMGKDENDENCPAVNGQHQSLWLRRRSKETLVDVRIDGDVVNIRLTQKKKKNVLFMAAKAVEELQLDLLHVAGRNIEDYYVFLFNAELREGSSLEAGAVANKLFEAMAGECTTPHHGVQRDIKSGKDEEQSIYSRM